jgi:alpha,alpha-trehalose-phosphate synthase [UDP-forming]
MDTEHGRSVVCSRQTLHDLARREFRGRRFIAVSNREPYIHNHERGGIECAQPAGGLTAALDPILQATGGTWVAHGSGDADRLVVDARDHVAVPPERPVYTLRRVWLDEETEQHYYYGLANEGLWPLCHTAFERPAFRLRDWQAYRKANRIFADAVLEEAAGQAALVFIQDYHFALLPRMLKERNPKLTVVQFWHIPWPNAEMFQIFPWRQELLEGLLGNDLLGFHLPGHCTNFLETVDRTLDAMVDRECGEAWCGGSGTHVQPFPISIDFERHAAQAAGAAVEAHMERWRAELDNPELLGIGIDRADYTKGIPDRLRAVDRLLETRPEYRGRLVFLQVAPPSRTRIEHYRRLNVEVERLTAEINARWGRPGWRPVYLAKRQMPPEEMMALHRLADFCLISSLHDGMNLVAKEYAASRVDGDGVLILSRFAGAASELTAAVPVNPFCTDEMAEAIVKAATMPAPERRRRMDRLRATVRENNVYRWAGAILRTAGELDWAGMVPAEEGLAAAASGRPN